MLLLQKLADLIGDLHIIQVGEREMGVAFNADFRQVNHLHIAAVFIHHISPLARHRQPHSPAILRRHGAGFIRDVVAVEDQNRNLGCIINAGPDTSAASRAVLADPELPHASMREAPGPT